MSHPRFSIIPAGAVTDRSLEPRDLQVLCLLGRHTDRDGWCVRSQVKMAQEIDCGRGSVPRSLGRLYEAGWVEKKRRDTKVEAENGHTSASHAYRVKLDRDDYAFESVTKEADTDDEDSHAETASEEGGCSPVGTQGGAQPDGHPGAQPWVGTGAHVEMGTKNVPLEQTPLERERDARARDRKARFLVAFEARWPTAAADNRQRTAYAAGELAEAEETAALAGIAPFLDNQKRLHRKNVPAGWRYLEEKRWTLLEAAAADKPSSTAHARDSLEAKALATLHDIVGTGDFFRKVHRRSDGTISYPRPVTPQLAALAQAGPPTDWVTLTRPQAGAWETLFRETVTVQVRRHLKEGDRAPWPWPPSVDGKIYTSATGPPEALITDQERADFK